MSVTRMRLPVLGGALLALSLAVAGCNAGSSTDTGGGPTDALKTQPSKVSAPRPKAQSNVARGATDVPVDRRVTVTAQNGVLKAVAVTSKAGPVPGRLSADKESWTAGSLLEPGTSYTIVSSLTGDGGTSVTRTRHFMTTALTLDQQTFPSIAPLAGQTVGVGMPVIVTFDVAVTDRASIEKHLHVISQPAQKGSWHWISDHEVHWRPAHYWKAGTHVTVNTDINSIPAGNGIYGQLDRSVSFDIGAAHVYKVNAKTDQMQVFSDGKLLRTVPITTGKPGFVTRSGTKVIIEKFPHKRMNSETIGINPNGPNGYNIGNVQWAMRLTYSGEFLHAAPWSVAYQGHSNVSHGCTGMSTSNADWLYHMTNVGDVVETTGTTRHMTLTNGYGDWNESFAQYRQGSALS
jgi:lipoprotein-anchoring transpeptidase ErfK/SrfK